MKRIRVTVKPDGQTTVETQGYAGHECRQADGWLRDALGLSATDTPTAEAFTEATQDQTLEITDAQ